MTWCNILLHLRNLVVRIVFHFMFRQFGFLISFYSLSMMTLWRQVCLSCYRLRRKCWKISNRRSDIWQIIRGEVNLKKTKLYVQEYYLTIIMSVRKCQGMQNTVKNVCKMLMPTVCQIKFAKKNIQENIALNAITKCKTNLSFRALSQSSFVRFKSNMLKLVIDYATLTRHLIKIICLRG